MWNPEVFVNKEGHNSNTCKPRTAAVPLGTLDTADTNPS